LTLVVSFVKILKFSKYIFSKKKIFVNINKKYFEIFYFEMESSNLIPVMNNWKWYIGDLYGCPWTIPKTIKKITTSFSNLFILFLSY